MWRAIIGIPLVLWIIFCPEITKRQQVPWLMGPIDSVISDAAHHVSGYRAPVNGNG
jgi:hypothetical protein